MRYLFVILGANWFAKLYSAGCGMDSRFRGNDSAGFVANHFRGNIIGIIVGHMLSVNAVSAQRYSCATTVS